MCGVSAASSLSSWVRFRRKCVCFSQLSLGVLSLHYENSHTILDVIHVIYRCYSAFQFDMQMRKMYEIDLRLYRILL